MSIRALAAYQAVAHGTEPRKGVVSRRAETAAGTGPRMPIDRFESTKPVDPETDRKAKIEEVRNRVKGGFYNRPEVVEDIGEVFARYFDRAIR